LLYFGKHFGEVREDLVIFEKGVFLGNVGDYSAESLSEEVGQHS
jgi:hypothetical protein